jgi:hypothetical protein
MHAGDGSAEASREGAAWFTAEPWRTSRELLERLQAEQPGIYPDGLLRTLQRRLKIWRSEIAHNMVFGAINSRPPVESKASRPAVLAGGRTGGSEPSLAARARLGRRKDWLTFEWGNDQSAGERSRVRQYVFSP